MKNLLFLLFASLAIPLAQASDQTDSSLSSDMTGSELMALSLDDLMQVQVITASRQAQSIDEAPANVTVVTAKTIQRRGYRNVIEVLMDIPGFDFSTYEDGGGEYPTHSSARGIGGDPGNSKLLVMVDNMVQNHIAFNWAYGLGDEQLLNDVERIEIVQGPASALYGANAMAGVVHIITSRDNNNSAQAWLGSDSGRQLNVNLAHQQQDFSLNLALKGLDHQGDMGEGRHDPAGYFNDNQMPNILLADYNQAGQYQTDTMNPYAGQALADGFNTNKEGTSARLLASWMPASFASVDSLTIGGSYWDLKQGLASYVSGFEYQMRDDDFVSHSRSHYLYLDGVFSVNERNQLSSRVWNRINQQLPNTGFRYTYQFPDLRKTYHSESRQNGLELQLNSEIGTTATLVTGLRFLDNHKMQQGVSLGLEQDVSHRYTSSSWDLATMGDAPALNQKAAVLRREVREQAVFAEFSDKLNDQFSYTAGGRYDESEDFGDAFSPRASLIFDVPVDKLDLALLSWNVKLNYGRAFREPSMFELTDEFRGNQALKPEESSTWELTSRINWLGESQDWLQSATFTTSLFHNSLTDLIALVPDASSAADERYANSQRGETRGISFDGQFVIDPALSFYLNYQWMHGHDGDGDWRPMDNVSRQKLNYGLDWQLNAAWFIHARANHLLNRKTPPSNAYYGRYAPDVTLINLTASWHKKLPQTQDKLIAQLVVKNLFDNNWAGVGRQNGTNDVNDWHPDTNPNPAGFAPPYHPQPGRTWWLNAKVEW